MRVSRTVLRGTSGETPEVYSPDDSDVLESEYTFQLTIYPPIDRKQGVGCLAESLEAVATALAQTGLKVFEPTGNWFHLDWDGSGRKFST